jgi:hypothetical protein
MAKLCEICDERPAAVPDRERMGRPIKRVCRECHAQRLAGDMREIMRLRKKRAKQSEGGQ